MRSHCSSANLPSCSGSSSRARSKSRWRRRPDATFRLATGQLLQSFRVPSPFHLISLTLSKLALWSANLPLSDEVRIARHRQKGAVDGRKRPRPQAMKADDLAAPHYSGRYYQRTLQPGGSLIAHSQPTCEVEV